MIELSKTQNYINLIIKDQNRVRGEILEILSSEGLTEEKESPEIPLGEVNSDGVPLIPKVSTTKSKIFLTKS